uniref:transposase n=1 Tax=Streptomyces longwoodensis TaxID=68231 RepID=UPI003B2207F6
MPGVGDTTGARILLKVGEANSFPTAGHLAAYKGFAPAARSRAPRWRGEQPFRRRAFISRDRGDDVASPRPAGLAEAGHGFNDGAAVTSSQGRVITP